MPQHAHSSGFLLYAARRTRLKALTNDMSAVRGEILTWTSLTASYVCSVAANYKQACFVSGPPRTAPRFAGHLALQSVFALSGGGVTSRANGIKKKKTERERERKSSAPSSMPVYRDIHQRLYPHLSSCEQAKPVSRRRRRLPRHSPGLPLAALLPPHRFLPPLAPWPSSVSVLSLWLD